MRIEVLRVKDLRNYEAAEFSPAAGTTLVLGPNGSGKSSLLEVAALHSTLASPRAPSLRVLVRHGCAEGGTRLEGDDGTSLEVRLRDGRSVLRSQGSAVRPKDYLGRFRSVLFTPEDLDIVRGEPALRRRTIDALLVQMRPRYRSTYRDFERSLRQRNVALRDGLVAEAELYSDPLANAAADVLDARCDVLDALAPEVAALYGELAGSGDVHLAYVDSSEAAGRRGEELATYLRELYRRSVASDLERGRTSAGPHRDDVDVTLDGQAARWYASRGEQRSIALALRLAELRLLPDAVLMLDDVLSELDPVRRRNVLGIATGTQSVLTATDRAAVPPGTDVAAVWTVADGSLRREGEA